MKAGLKNVFTILKPNSKGWWSTEFPHVYAILDSGKETPSEIAKTDVLLDIDNSNM